jgi:hypothetical protein
MFIQFVLRHIRVYQKLLPALVPQQNNTKYTVYNEARVETKMHFSMFPYMRKWANFRKISRSFVSQKFFVFSSQENFAKKKFSRKTKNLTKFDGDTSCMVHVVSFLYIALHFGQIKRTYV